MHTGADPLWICSRLYPIHTGPVWTPLIRIRSKVVRVCKQASVRICSSSGEDPCVPTGPEWIRSKLVRLFYPIQTSTDSIPKLDQTDEVSCVRKAYSLQFGNKPERIRSRVHRALRTEAALFFMISNSKIRSFLGAYHMRLAIMNLHSSLLIDNCVDSTALHLPFKLSGKQCMYSFILVSKQSLSNPCAPKGLII